MLDNFFIVWPYSEEFHAVTGIGFLILAGISIIYAARALHKLLTAIDGVVTQTTWNSCTSKACVKRQLYQWFIVVFVKGCLVVWVMFRDAGENWLLIPHEDHILHYGIVFVFIGLLGLCRRSTRHFGSLKDCPHVILRKEKKWSRLEI